MRVLLVDDHRLVVEGLTNLLTAHGIEVVDAACDGWDAVEKAAACHPDVVLMDIRMPRWDGLFATRLITAQMPRIRVVMLTTSAEDDDLFEAIKSGASGYLLKTASGEEFIQSLEALDQGTPPFSPGLAARLMSEFARRSAVESGPVEHPDDPVRRPEKEVASGGEREGGLTARQADVLKAVAGGLTYKEVGARLGLSERTVRYHMAEIMDRLHLEHRSQVIAYAGKMGLNPETA